MISLHISLLFIAIIVKINNDISQQYLQSNGEKNLEINRGVIQEWHHALNWLTKRDDEKRLYRYTIVVQHSPVIVSAFTAPKKLDH